MVIQEAFVRYKTRQFLFMLRNVFSRNSAVHSGMPTAAAVSVAGTQLTEADPMQFEMIKLQTKIHHNSSEPQTLLKSWEYCPMGMPC